MPGPRHFSKQKALLMRMLGVGQRKVWLDPTKMEIISKAKTRQDMWNLVKEGVVRRKFTQRGTWNTAKGPFLYLTPEKAAKIKEMQETKKEEEALALIEKREQIAQKKERKITLVDYTK